MELIFEIEDHFDIRLEQAASYPKTLGEVFDQIKAAINKTDKADASIE
jgi:acyl carrier protein